MSFLGELRRSLLKTSGIIKEGFDRILKGGKVSSEDLDELEAVLIGVDVGVRGASEIIDEVREQLKRGKAQEPSAIAELLRQSVAGILERCNRPLVVAENPPTVYVLVGVNGSGKTTTAAKIAYRWVSQGKTVVAAACDTFRAAAAEQLEAWSKRVGMEIVKQTEGSDPAAVAFDAARAAIARARDLLLVDTAGRLHTRKNLMEELKKIVRVVSREIPGAPHEVLLVMDATTGQNGLSQARVFLESVGVTGVVLTKLDGSAKGGIAVAIARELGLPVKLVGIGEGPGDLREFVPEDFARALFAGVLNAQ